MKDGPLQFTLRRLQALLTAPRFWGVLVTVALILGVTGPFGTFRQMPLLPRLGYWLAIALATFVASYATIVATMRYLGGDIGLRPVRVALSGLVAGVPVTAIVLLFDYALFADTPGSAVDVLAFYAECSLIAAGISLVFGLVNRPAEPRPAGDAGAETGEPERPPILSRLPAHLRGELRYMSMQDHYVDVYTNRGNALVLMRFADAMAETGSTAGLQVHRSHWVALDAVAGTERRQGRLFVKMQNGTLLPVSRSYLGAAREAGIG